MKARIVLWNDGEPDGQDTSRSEINLADVKRFPMLLTLTPWNTWFQQIWRHAYYQSRLQTFESYISEIKNFVEAMHGDKVKISSDFAKDDS